MRFRSLLVIVGVLASGLAAAQPAQAAPAAHQALPTCTLKMPARLSIRTARPLVEVPLGSDCPSTMYQAGWLANWRGTQGGFGTSCGYHSTCGVLLDELPIGLKVTWVGESAGDYLGHEVAIPLTAYSTTKYASSGALSGGRKGTRTALLSTAGYYNAKTHVFVRWPARKLLLQYQEIGSSTWRGLTYVTTNAKGQVTYSYYPGRARRYRLYIPGTSSIWDLYTPVISR
jgi:hypothetical protein